MRVGGVILACWGLEGWSAGWQGGVWGGVCVCRGAFTMNFGVFVDGVHACVWGDSKNTSCLETDG